MVVHLLHYTKVLDLYVEERKKHLDEAVLF